MLTVHQCVGQRGDRQGDDQSVREVVLLSWWSPEVIRRGQPGFTRPQSEMSCQLYGSWEYIRTMLGAMWSPLQACGPQSSCCLMVHRDALSQQGQKHTHAQRRRRLPPTSWLSDIAKNHNYTRLSLKGPTLCVWMKTGPSYKLCKLGLMGFFMAVNPLSKWMFQLWRQRIFLTTLLETVWSVSRAKCKHPLSLSGSENHKSHCAWVSGRDWKKKKKTWRTWV